MRKAIVALAILFCSFPLFAGGVDLIYPRGISGIENYYETPGIPHPEHVIGPSGHIEMVIEFIGTDSATSNVFQPFVFRVTSSEGVDWSTLYFSMSTYGGAFAYPEDEYPIIWQIGWIDPRDDIDWETLFSGQELSYSWWIDTLSDSTWDVHIYPGPKVNPVSFAYGMRCHIFDYVGPAWIITGDTLSPGFGMWFNADSFGPAHFILLVRLSPGGPILRCSGGLGIDYNGPSASDPYPANGSVVSTDSLLEIRVVVLDTYSYDYGPYLDPDSSRRRPTEPHCHCYADPCCTTSTGEWLDYPYCFYYTVYRAKIDTTSIRLSVNGREYTLESPGMHWLHDSLVVFKPEEAGVSFAPGETVRVCLEEATDRTSQGYGPNHLGRYRDWTHPDTPIPFCWEFYIAGTGIEEAAATPEGFGIKSIKPNPFNTATQIVFSLNRAADVDVGVINLKGEKVEQLVESRYEEGCYEIKWSAKSLPTGLYFVVLRADDATDIKKVILLK